MEIEKISGIKRVSAHVYPSAENAKKKNAVQLSAETAEMTARMIEKAIESQKEAFENVKMLMAEMGLNNSVSIEYDQETRQVIVQVIDGDTKAVVKQFPAEEFLNFMKKFHAIVGLIINENA